MSRGTDAGAFVVGVELDGDGAHPAAWRASGHTPAELLSGRTVAARVAAAERAGFTFASFDDSPLPPSAAPDITARIDAVQRAAFAAPLTGAIGLIPAAHSTYSEPFHVGTQLASLDFAAGGRAGWLVTADPDARIAALYGRPAVDADAARERAADAVEVARRLWDSWEDDAEIRDVATGRYLDRDRVHYTAFAGGDYSIVGPAIVPRPPQGQLPVFGDAALSGSVELDVALLTAGTDADDTTELIAAVAAGAAAARASDRTGTALVVVELDVVLDHAGVDAADRLEALDGHTAWSTERARFVGSAPALVDLLTGLASVVDGVRLHPAVLDIDLDELGRAVLPRLRAAGVFTSPAPGGTLRDSLGLARPVSRYATAR